MNEEIRQATEAAQSPASYGFLTYGWVLALSAWGGTVRFIRMVKAGNMTLKQAIKVWIGELITSAFAGVMTFYLAEAAGFSQLWTAVLVGIAGHMGAKALEPLEVMYRRFVDHFNPRKGGDQ